MYATHDNADELWNSLSPWNEPTRATLGDEVVKA